MYWYNYILCTNLLFYGYEVDEIMRHEVKVRTLLEPSWESKISSMLSILHVYLANTLQAVCYLL